MGDNADTKHDGNGGASCKGPGRASGSFYTGEYGGVSFKPRNAIANEFQDPFCFHAYSPVTMRTNTVTVTQNFTVGVGGCVWECGDLLRRFLVAEQQDVLKHTKTISTISKTTLPWTFLWNQTTAIELGCGTAIGALAAAAAGAKAVCATDFAHVLDAVTRANAASNKHLGCPVALREWSWGNEEHEAEIIKWIDDASTSGSANTRKTKAAKSRGDKSRTSADLAPQTLLVLGADLAYVPEVFDKLVACLQSLERASQARGWKFAFAFAHRPRLPAAEDLLLSLEDIFSYHAFVSSSLLDKRYQNTKYAATTGVRIYTSKRNTPNVLLETT